MCVCVCVCVCTYYLAKTSLNEISLDICQYFEQRVFFFFFSLIICPYLLTGCPSKICYCSQGH